MKDKMRVQLHDDNDSSFKG